MHKNIPKYYLFQFFYALSFAFVPFFIIFMSQRGLSFSQIGICLSVYYFAFLFFELPTGIIADKMGRQRTIILTTIIKFLAVLWAFYSHSLQDFVIAELLLSLARAMGSGATTALLYDSLLYIKQEDNYKQIQGKAYSMHLIGNTVGGGIGALLTYFYSVDYVYIFAALMAVMAFLVAITLKESLPELESKDVLSVTLKEYGLHFFSSLKVVYSNKLILWIIAYSTLVFVLIRANLISIQQPFLMALMIPTFWFGIVDTCISLGAAFWSFFSHKLERWLSFDNSLMFMVGVAILSFLGMGLVDSIWAIVFLLMQMITVGIYAPIIRDFMQKQIVDSHKRATILSIESLVTRTAFALYALLIGYLLETFSVQMASLVTAALGIVIFVLLWSVKPKTTYLSQ